MMFSEKLKEYTSKMTDVELFEAVSHLDDVTFDDDNVIRLMFEFAKDDDNRFLLYLPAITKALCEEAEEKGFFTGTFNGGFVGDDVDLLVEHMGRWLTENKFM